MLKGKKGGPDPDALTATQKLAALLIVLGEDIAAMMLKEFDDNERELVCAEMANLPLLDQLQQGEVLQEFTQMAVAASSGLSGSVDYTRQVLEKSVGLFKAAEVIGRRCARSAARRALSSPGRQVSRGGWGLAFARTPTPSGSRSGEPGAARS